MIKNIQITLIIFAIFCFCVVDNHPIAAFIAGCALALAAGLDHIHELIKHSESLENDLYEHTHDWNDNDINVN